jgi:hypothetical protein
MIEVAEERMSVWVILILDNWYLFGSWDLVMGAF